MNPKRTRRLIADAGLIYAAAVWGSTFSLVKACLDVVDPVVLVAYRSLIASAVMGAFLCFWRVPIRPSLVKGAVLGFILWTLYVSQTVGLQFTTASNSGFITGLFIIFVPLLSYVLFRKVPDARRVFAVLLAFAGLCLLTGGLVSLNLGDLLTLFAAVTYALHILYADRWVQGDGNPYALSFVQFATVGVLSAAAVPFYGADWTVGADWAVWIIVFLALFPTLSAFLIQLVAQRITGPVKVALIFALEPVFAAVTAWTLGGEPLILLNAIGGGLIVAGIMLSGFPTRTVKPREEVVVDLHAVATPVAEPETEG